MKTKLLAAVGGRTNSKELAAACFHSAVKRVAAHAEAGPDDNGRRTAFPTVPTARQEVAGNRNILSNMYRPIGLVVCALVMVLRIGAAQTAPVLSTPAVGSIASLSGAGLAAPAVTTAALPLPVTLGETTVILLADNFQFPYETCCTEQMPVKVIVNGGSSNAVMVACRRLRDLVDDVFGGLLRRWSRGD